jgi:hypothetical protein
MTADWTKLTSSWTSVPRRNRIINKKNWFFLDSLNTSVDLSYPESKTYGRNRWDPAKFRSIPEAGSLLPFPDSVSSYFPVIPGSGSDIRIWSSCPGRILMTDPSAICGRQDMGRILSCQAGSWWRILRPFTDDRIWFVSHGFLPGSKIRIERIKIDESSKI